MARRVSMTPKRRAEVFRNANGICHLCCRKIGAGEVWEVEHPRALGLGGIDDHTNWLPAHVDCHAGKTRSDIKIMRKADRQLVAWARTKSAAKPLPGSKASRWKKKMNGMVVER